MKIIAQDLVPVYETDIGQKVVNGRELHQFLDVGKDFSTWMKDRIEKYGFEEGIDFTLTLTKVGERSNVTRHDYFIQLDTAKEIAMVENNEQGRKVRRYFIQIEKKHKTQMSQPQLPQNYKEALIALVGEVEKNERLQLENAELRTKVKYVDQILMCKATMTITQIAKDYGLSGPQLNKILHEEKVQYKQNRQWLLYQKYSDKGYTRSETIDITRSNGDPDVTLNTRWTQKGRLFIHEILAKREIVPYMDRQHKAAQ